MAKEQKLKFKIVNLSVKDKVMDWSMKIKALFGVTEAKRNYKVNVQVDDEYFDKKIDTIQKKITERKSNPDMFDDYKASVKTLEKDIDKINEERADAEALEIQEFEAVVASADFDKNTLVFQIPQDRVEEIIKIRQNIEAYLVVLK